MIYEKPIKPDDGLLFAYKITTLWKTDMWDCTVTSTGFCVRGQFGNMINPGAPGFCCTFYHAVLVCPPSTRRHCWELHIFNNGAPAVKRTQQN